MMALDCVLCDCVIVGMMMEVLNVYLVFIVFKSLLPFVFRLKWKVVFFCEKTSKRDILVCLQLFIIYYAMFPW